ncbi:MAG: hypothetical protein JW915_21005 [Chitinispirillaceae bacterium]|nr:hypothetical protein [Chitinispirillaceae bacterium]
MKTIPNGISFLLLLIFSCASVKTEGVKSAVGTDLEKNIPLQPYPPFSGEKLRIQVVEFKMAPEIAVQYPQLAEKQVGMGLSSRMIDEFYETKRFTFVEEKADMQEKLMAQWALSQSGIIAESQQINSDGISAPQFLVYAELVDFSVSNSEVVKGLSLEKRATTRITFQIRFLNVSTGEFVPSSGTGEATSIAASVWVNPELPFDQSTVGIATQRALRNAVFELLKRVNL